MNDEEKWWTTLSEINDELRNHEVGPDNMVQLSVLCDALAAALTALCSPDDDFSADLEETLLHLKANHEPLSQYLDEILFTAVQTIAEETSRAHYWAEKDQMPTSIRQALESAIGKLTRTIDCILEVRSC